MAERIISRGRTKESKRTTWPVDGRKRPPQSASSSSDSEDDVVEDSRKRPHQSAISFSSSEDDVVKAEKIKKTPKGKHRAQKDNLVENVLHDQYTYLHKNLPMTNDLAATLYGWKPPLLDKSTSTEITALNINGKPGDAFQKWYHYATSWYTEESLKNLCVCLKKSGKSAKPKLLEVAKNIKRTLKATQGEPTPTVFTVNERSQKIKKIVDMYRSENTDISLPEIPELADDFDDILETLNAKLLSADHQVISKLVVRLRMKYRRYIHGLKPVKLPSIPETPHGLYEFIAAKSTAYETLLVHHACDVLDTNGLKGTLRDYESKLGKHLRRALKSYKKKKVTLPLYKDRAHFAVILSKEQVLLSLVLHIKDYLKKYLDLEETRFEGFGEGCTVLFFSILQVDAVILAPKILSHSAELKRVFDITYLVMFDYFACDLERATIELPDTHSTALKAETTLKETKVSLDEALTKSEKLEHQLMSARMKHIAEKEKLEKEKEMFKKSTVILAKQKDELQRQISTFKGTLCKEHLDTIEKAVGGYQKIVTFFDDSGLLEEKLDMSIDDKLHHLAVKKRDEVDSMLMVLRTKQEELKGDEFLPLILEREEREAALKEEIATLKATLEEKELQLKNQPSSISGEKKLLIELKDSPEAMTKDHDDSTFHKEEECESSTEGTMSVSNTTAQVVLTEKVPLEEDLTDSIAPSPKGPQELDCENNQPSNIDGEEDPLIEIKDSPEAMTKGHDSPTLSPEERDQSVAEDSVKQAAQGHVEHAVHSSGPGGSRKRPDQPCSSSSLQNKHSRENSDIGDMSPSDIGLQGILNNCPLWYEYAISLGLSADTMKYYLEQPQEALRGLLALKYWRDGQCGSGYPTTWKFLLDVIKDCLGPNVAEDLEKLIITNDTWTLTSPTESPSTHDIPGPVDRPQGSTQKDPLGDPLVQKLKGHAYNQYERFKVGEGGRKMEYVRLAVLPGQPDARREPEKANDPLVFLKRYKDFGREGKEVDRYIDASELLRKGSDNLRVIYGQAGIGKTTLLEHISRALARKEVESDYTLVLYFPLREKTVSSAKDLEELLSYYALGDKKLDLSELSQSLIDTSGKDVLFVFDGADEVRELFSTGHSSIFQEIIQGRSLPQADVIVTSRPGSLPILQEHSTVFYEIHGFDGESVQSYVREFFQAKPEEGQKMLDELRSRPDLMGGAYIPMNLFIFCSIYAGRTFPPTMTLCYKQFICNVITRECEKSGIPCRVDPLLNRLSDDVKRLLDSLSSLAYEGMMTTPPTFVFDEDDILRAFPTLQPEVLIEESLFKGLLHQHSSAEGYLTSSTFNFSHTTNQEFFTAYHLAHLPVDEQLQFVQENFTNVKFSVVFRFYAGLTGLSPPEVSSFLCHPHPQSHASYSQSSVHSLSLPSECTYDDPHLLYLFHSLYESQNSDLTRNIVQHLDQSFTFKLHLTSHDTLAIAHCLSKCTHFRALQFSSYLNPSSLPHIFSILQANVHLQYLRLRVDHLSSADACSLISVTLVKRLTLEVQVTTLSALSAIFASTTIVNLSLGVNDLKTDIDNEQSKSELIRSVAENTTLRKLHLGGEPYFMVPVLHGVAGNSTIEDLEVQEYIHSGDDDDDDVAEALATTCVANTKLRRVEMCYIPPLPVMKSLATRQVPLEELGILAPGNWGKRVFSEDELKEMETYAAEMKVVEIIFNVRYNTGVYDAISMGLGSNQVLKQVTLGSVPKEKIEFIKSKLSSIKTVTVTTKYVQ